MSREKCLLKSYTSSIERALRRGRQLSQVLERFKRGRLMVIDSGDGFNSDATSNLTCCMAACAISQQIESSQLLCSKLIRRVTERNSVFIVPTHATFVRTARDSDGQ